MGSQRVAHDWTTELNWTELSSKEGNYKEDSFKIFTFISSLLFIWLCQVLFVACGALVVAWELLVKHVNPLVVTCQLSVCGMWDLVAWPGIEPGSCWECGVITTGPLWKSQDDSKKKSLWPKQFLDRSWQVIEIKVVNLVWCELRILL